MREEAELGAWGLTDPVPSLASASGGALLPPDSVWLSSVSLRSSHRWRLSQVTLLLQCMESPGEAGVWLPLVGL